MTSAYFEIGVGVSHYCIRFYHEYRTRVGASGSTTMRSPIIGVCCEDEISREGKEMGKMKDGKFILALCVRN